MNPKQTLLIVGGGFCNMGAEAMVRVASEEIVRRVPDLEVLVATTRRPPGNWVPAGMKTVRASDFLQRILLALSRRSGNTYVFQRVIAARGAQVVSSRVRAPVWLVDVSGFTFDGRWGRLPALSSLALLVKVVARGGRGVFCPQSWGPFSDPRVVDSIRAICGAAHLVYARDDDSYGHLQEAAGTGASHVRIAPDIGFLLRAPSDDNRRLLRTVLPDNVLPRNVIGICPSYQVQRVAREGGREDAYVGRLVAITRACIDRLHAAVVLIPHQYDPSAKEQNDDRGILRAVRNAFSHSEPVYAILERLDSVALKSVIRSLDFLVSSRFHAIVAAASTFVPVMAIGWAEKYEQLLASIGLGGYSVRFKPGNPDSDIALLLDGWRRRAETSSALRRRVPPIVRKVERAFDDIVQALEGRGDTAVGFRSPSEHAGGEETAI